MQYTAVTALKCVYGIDTLDTGDVCSILAIGKFRLLIINAVDRAAGRCWP